MQGATCTSGAITIHTPMEEPPGAFWGSVCYPRLLRHTPTFQHNRTIIMTVNPNLIQGFLHGTISFSVVIID